MRGFAALVARAVRAPPRGPSGRRVGGERGGKGHDPVQVRAEPGHAHQDVGVAPAVAPVHVVRDQPRRVGRLLDRDASRVGRGGAPAAQDELAYLDALALRG